MSSTYILTCLCPSPNSEILDRISSFLDHRHIQVLNIRTLSQENPFCFEMQIVNPPDTRPEELTAILLEQTATPQVDMIIQEDSPVRCQKKFIAMDMDSTLIQVEVIDELAKEAGIGDAVAQITRRAMNGELNFNESLQERVSLLKGLPDAVLKTVYDRIPLTEGVEDLLCILQKKGYKTAVLSGGFDYFTSRIKARLRLDYAYSNTLEIKNGILTGNILGEIVDGRKKADLIVEISKKEQIPLNQSIVIGDGANDLPMIHKAGLGIAFNAKPAVRASAHSPLPSWIL